MASSTSAGAGASGGLPPVMPSAVYRRPGDIGVEERPVPRPGPDQVLVEVAYCGICGSDLHIMIEGWGKPGSVGGHEFTGTVAAVGDDVTTWVPGDVVVCGPSPRCGECRRCREGKPSQCERRSAPVDGDTGGAFARYVLTGARSLLRLPEGMSPRVAALAEPLAVALHGITRSGIVPGDAAMVFGAGPIGALTIAALVAKDLGPVVVVEPGERRRQLAADLGAAEVLDPSQLETFPPWHPERLSPRAVDVVFECSGKKAAMEAGFNQLRRGGHLVLVGAGMEAPSFDPNRLILNELTVTGSFVYDADGFERALELLASGRLPVEVLIDPDDVSLEGLGEAMLSLAEGRIAGKVMVIPGAAPGRRVEGD
ncbi:MAG TPA: alcohol dehydrogenase catalytic domain-containing protein [Acidimicrobiales bacterium]|nr:alcohol dehydrogenase catalytic domain-containing protein [Acidimicrobiales bacterium]HLN41700.1 alcohol dehydrogenase catalytic domain-containing protein [Acidimicrobiales bacterium]